jgi:NAD(P)-dependent dehydrogenase (short-subunit alcohol dehydrogenase family)
MMTATAIAGTFITVTDIKEWINVERYEGRRVVITRGTSGMGLATAQLLLDGGARVLVTGRTQASLDAARDALSAGAIVIHSDATSPADIDALAERVKSEFGTLDLLFVSAGATGFAPFESMTEAAYDEMFTINAKAPYFTVQRLAPLMAGGSAVVLTTSVVNAMGWPLVSAYAATKAALQSMTRSLARELLPRDIRVNAVSPGPVDTSILHKAMPETQAEQTKSEMAQDNPMKRLGRPEEIARAAAFLAFEATYTTGAELVVDGGASQLCVVKPPVRVAARAPAGPAAQRWARRRERSPAPTRWSPHTRRRSGRAGAHRRAGRA